MSRQKRSKCDGCGDVDVDNLYGAVKLGTCDNHGCAGTWYEWDEFPPEEQPKPTESFPEQVRFFVVLVPGGDRPFPWRSVSEEMLAQQPPGTRVYEVEFYAHPDDLVGKNIQVNHRPNIVRRR